MFPIFFWIISGIPLSFLAIQIVDAILTWRFERKFARPADNPVDELPLTGEAIEDAKKAMLAYCRRLEQAGFDVRLSEHGTAYSASYRVRSPT